MRLAKRGIAQVRVIGVLLVELDPDADGVAQVSSDRRVLRGSR
jgi:hypothetical protein